MIAGKNKELYYTESIDKQLNIEVIGTKHVIDNTTREQDTFTLTETLNDGTELKFGSCLPNQISFTGREVPIATKGMKLRPVEILEGNEDDPFVYGTYTVQSDTPTADRTKRQIVAYDAMYDIINVDAKSWYDGLSFPMTLKAFRDSFFAHLGIEQKETSLVNDSMTVNKTLVTTQSEDSSVTAEATISGKTIIEAICEINGAFGNIGRDGRFEYVILPSIVSALYPAEDLYPADDLFPSDANTESMAGHYITFDYESFQSKAITQLEIRADDSTAGAVVGNAGNAYVISGNFLISDKTGAELEQIANNLLPIMKQAAYTPIKSCTCVGNPCLELGDPIRFNTSQEIVETYILQRTLTGVQSKRDSIVSQGAENHSKNTNSMRETLANVQRRTSILERNADHLLAQFNDLDENTSSQLEMTASQIQAEVMARLNSEAEMSTRISQSAHSIGLTASGGDQSVGLTIQLYDENGNVIDTSSDNANITVTGFVSFWDLANSGSTTINGDNITTGTIRGTNSEFTNMKFLENVYYRYPYGGQIYDYPIFKVEQLGILEFGGSDMHTDFNGSCLFKDTRVYLGSVTQKNKIATIGDIPSVPNLSGYINSVGSSSWDTITSNNWVVTSFSLSKSGSSIYVSGNHIKKSLSDQRLKEDLGRLDERYAEFYKMLNPIIFKFHDDIPTIKGKHFGLYANEVADALDKANIDRSGLRLVWQSEVDSEAHEDRYINDRTWNLDYDELHALHIYMIQKQHKEIEELKQENFSLKGEMDILKQRLEKMEEMLNVINSKIS